MITLDVIGAELPAGFDVWLVEASAEGYRFPKRLADDWASGVIRFDRPGEMLLAARCADVLAGIGGVTIDPVVPGALRMRRFYVSARFRRCGVGRRLASALLERALHSTAMVTVNAATGSIPFWEALGFIAAPRDGHTHVLVRPHLAVELDVL